MDYYDGGNNEGLTMLTMMMTAMVMIVLTMTRMIGVREIIIRMTEIYM